MRKDSLNQQCKHNYCALWIVQSSPNDVILKEADNEISINKIYDSIAPTTKPFLP